MDFGYPELDARTNAGNEFAADPGVVIIGDSLLDGRGSTKGKFEQTIATCLKQKVVNNAVGGYTIADIY